MDTDRRLYHYTRVRFPEEVRKTELSVSQSSVMPSATPDKSPCRSAGGNDMAATMYPSSSTLSFLGVVFQTGARV